MSEKNTTDLGISVDFGKPKDLTTHNDGIVASNRALANRLIDSGEIKPDEAILVGLPQKHVDRAGLIERPSSPSLQHVDSHEDLRIFEVPGVSESLDKLILASIPEFIDNAQGAEELHTLSKAVSVCVPKSLIENKMECGDGFAKIGLALEIVGLARLVQNYRDGVLTLPTFEELGQSGRKQQESVRRSLDYILGKSLHLEITNPYMSEQELMDFYQKTIGREVRKLAEFITTNKNDSADGRDGFMKVKGVIEKLGSVEGLTLLSRVSTSLYNDLDAPMVGLSSQLRLAELVVKYGFSEKYNFDFIVEELIKRDDKDDGCLDLFFDALLGTGYGFVTMSRMLKRLESDSIDRMNFLFGSYCRARGVEYQNLSNKGIDGYCNDSMETIGEKMIRLYGYRTDE